MTTAKLLTLRERCLAKPRAKPEDVQRVIMLWRDKPGNVTGDLQRDRGEFQVWCFRTCNHWFPPYGPFKAASWAAEDIPLCLAALGVSGSQSIDNSSAVGTMAST